MQARQNQVDAFTALEKDLFGNVSFKHKKTVDDIHATTVVSIKFVGDFIGTSKEKFHDKREIEYFASWYAEHKFLQPEVDLFAKKIERGSVKSWIYFTLTPETKNSVSKYLVQKMQTYRMGEIYQKKR